MKKIELTKGQFAMVDDDDFEELSKHKWWVGSGGYAAREVSLGTKDGKHLRKTVLMHRQILKAPDGMDVDHANHNKLDNRKSNIRLATRSQNKANALVKTRKQSELPMGVTYNPSLRSKKKFMARVCKDGKSYFVGNHAQSNRGLMHP